MEHLKLFNEFLNEYFDDFKIMNSYTKGNFVIGSKEDLKQFKKDVSKKIPNIKKDLLKSLKTIDKREFLNDVVFEKLIKQLLYNFNASITKLKIINISAKDLYFELKNKIDITKHFPKFDKGKKEQFQKVAIVTQLDLKLEKYNLDLTIKITIDFIRSLIIENKFIFIGDINAYDNSTNTNLKNFSKLKNTKVYFAHQIINNLYKIIASQLSNFKPIIKIGDKYEMINNFNKFNKILNNLDDELKVFNLNILTKNIKMN
jgi:hypothetical protein